MYDDSFINSQIEKYLFPRITTIISESVSWSVISILCFMLPSKRISLEQWNSTISNSQTTQTTNNSQVNSLWFLMFDSNSWWFLISGCPSHIRWFCLPVPNISRRQPPQPKTAYFTNVLRETSGGIYAMGHILPVITKQKSYRRIESLYLKSQVGKSFPYPGWTVHVTSTNLVSVSVFMF